MKDKFGAKRKKISLYQKMNHLEFFFVVFDNAEHFDLYINISEENMNEVINSKLKKL